MRSLDVTIKRIKNKKCPTKVEKQLLAWDERGQLKLLANWVAGRYNEGWSPCKIIQALVDKEVTDSTFSPPQAYEMVRIFTEGMFRMSGEDIVNVFAGESIVGMQSNNSQITQKVREYADELVRDKLGLGVKKDTDGIVINIVGGPGSNNGNENEKGQQLSPADRFNSIDSYDDTDGEFDDMLDEYDMLYGGEDDVGDRIDDAGYASSNDMSENNRLADTEDVSSRLSNINNLNTLDYLKDDASYEQLVKDKEAENNRGSNV